MKKITLIAVVFGGIIEWFDFILFAYFSTVFAKLFFPESSAETGLMLTLLIFAITFLIRPLGGLIIGFIGDRYGRRKALILTTSVMTLSSLSLAVLPTYNSIGKYAALLLAVIRLLQGLAVSGELTTTATYLVENAQKNRLHFFGSLTSTSASIGVALGALVTWFVYPWGWRLAFSIAGILACIAGILRWQIQEAPRAQKVSTRTVIEHRRIVILLILLAAPFAVGNYYHFAFMNHYIASITGLPISKIIFINFITILATCLLIPSFGLVADYVGLGRVLMIGLLGFITASLGIFLLLVQPSLALIFTGEFIYVIFLSMLGATIPVIMVKTFPSEIRSLGSGITYNLSFALFGGTAPVIALFLTDKTGITLSPAIYLSAIALLSLGSWIYYRSRKAAAVVL